MATEEYQDLRLEVGLLKKDVDQIGVLCAKLDTTIEKVQELTSAMTKMLALHEERIEKQEQRDTEILRILESRRTETESNVKELHSRITTIDKEHRQEMGELEDRMEKMVSNHVSKAVDEIRALTVAQKEHHEHMNERLNLVEKKIWMFVGGAIVFGFIASNFGEIITKIFG